MNIQELKKIDKYKVAYQVLQVLRLLLLSSTMKVENTLTSFTGISSVDSALIAYNFYKLESTLSLITTLEAIYINVQTSFESYVGTSTVYSYVVMNNVMFATVQLCLLVLLLYLQIQVGML